MVVVCKGCRLGRKMPPRWGFRFDWFWLLQRCRAYGADCHHRLPVVKEEKQAKGFKRM